MVAFHICGEKTGRLLLLAGPFISDWTLSSGPHPGTASLTWTVPDGSAVTSFSIQMQDPKQHRSAEEWSTVEELGATNRSTTVTGLQPQTAYAFRIVPYLGSQAGNATQIHTLQPGKRTDLVATEFAGGFRNILPNHNMMYYPIFTHANKY